MIEALVSLVAIGAVFGGQWLGYFIRGKAHVMVPFNDPVSIALFIIALIPLFIDVGLDE